MSIKRPTSGSGIIGNATSIRGIKISKNSPVNKCGLVYNDSLKLWIPTGCCTFDFTGVDYDTKAKAQAMYILFSDDDTPFPDELYGPVNGTWTHVVDVGWKAACAVDSEGPAIVLPLVRSYDWEAAVIFNFTASDVAEKVRLIVGTMMPDNDFGMLAFSQDNSAGATELVCSLYTNDGDDTLTVRFMGDPLAGTGERVIKIRNLNGCISVYDDKDEVWENYTGRQAPVGYTPSHVFLQVQKIGAADMSEITIKNLTVTFC